MTVNTLLRQLVTELTPTDRDISDALHRIGSAARLLDHSGFGLLDWEASGSCAKRTAISPVNDLDLFIYLDPEFWRSTRGGCYAPATVIRIFAERFELARRVHIDNGHLSIRRQNSSIGLRYHREGAVHIDIVPALWRDQNHHRVVEIPDRGGRGWVETCIRRQLSLLEREDDRFLNLRRGIRLLKIWRRGRKLKVLRPYALELLALHRWRNGAPRSEVGIFRSVLEWMVSTGMREHILITDVISQYTVPKRKAVVIMDVGVRDNNVAGNLDAPTRDGLVRVARETQRQLEWGDEELAEGKERAALRRLRRLMGLE